MQKQIIDDECFWRANTYSVLARLLSASADKQLLAILAAVELQLDAAEQPLAQAWKNLAVAATSADLQNVAEEYQQLFIGVTRGELLPYASYYLTGFLMEKPLASLREDLQILGIKRQENIFEPEDHAAALCEVMCLLIRDQQTVESDFFRKHLAPWMGIFFADLKHAKTAKFYRAVADLGSAFVDFEKNYLVIPE
jgi:TorA maturation chaperone TorD